MLGHQIHPRPSILTNSRFEPFVYSNRTSFIFDSSNLPFLYLSIQKFFLIPLVPLANRLHSQLIPPTNQSFASLKKLHLTQSHPLNPKRGYQRYICIV
jgi:hypothetical protein